MAGSKGEELDGLREEMRMLSERAAQLESKVDKLGGRMDTLDTFRNQAEPNIWIVRGAKWVVGLLAGGTVAALVSAVAGAVTFAFWLGSLSSDVKHQGERQVERLAAIEKTVNETRDANVQLHRIIIERLAQKLYGSAPREGKVVRAGNGELVIKTPEGKEFTFKRGAGAEVILDGKPAKLDALKPGTPVTVFPGEPGHFDRVEAGKGRTDLLKTPG